jgi:hypothetical protein
MMKSLRIHRNPHCAKCARFARMHLRLDWLGRLKDSTASPWPRSMRMGEVVIEDLRDGSLHAGADGLRLLCRAVPAYWPLLPLFALAPIRRRIDIELAGVHPLRSEHATRQGAP